MDSDFSPWPAAGRSFYFTWRNVVWVRANPWYGEYSERPSNLKVRRLPLPFLSINTRWFHLYLGWKPITVEDPKFYWAKWVDYKPGELFVQMSSRWGGGSIS